MMSCTTEGKPSGSRVPLEHLLAATEDEVDDRLTLSQEIDKMPDALVDLPDQERNVLSLYCFEELKLSEIAAILGVSEARVSQIRAKAIGRLRVSFRSLRDACSLPSSDSLG